MSDSRAPFRTTRWTLIRQAGGGEGDVSASLALQELCQSYWPPLYAFLRRRGSSPTEAEDLVQGFFASLLERRDLAQLEPDRGRFRSFLLAALRHFVSNERDHQRARKRGGRMKHVSLDVDSAERRFLVEPVEEPAAAAMFDRDWALMLLDRVRTRLREEQERAGRLERFQALEPLLTGEAPGSIREAAAQLGLTEGAAKVALHRLREDFRRLLREEIGQTVDGPDDVEDEICYLFQTLRG